MRSFCILLFLSICLVPQAQQFTLRAPSTDMELRVNNATGLSYELSYKGRRAVLPSTLALVLKEPAATLQTFTVTAVDSAHTDQTWQPVWGEYGSIRNWYRELRLTLQDRGGSRIALQVIFRLYNEGLAIRYMFPQQPALQHFVLADERTQIRLSGDHTAFWIPGDYDTNEYTYNTTKLSEVDASSGRFASEIHAKSFFAKNAVQTPLMLKSSDGLYINIHEAALRNYPAMNLLINQQDFTLQSHLVPDAVGNKAYLMAPFHTPWRTVIVSDKATEVLGASRMILNLNDPSEVGDTSWIRPQKMVGVWWEMHVGIGSWDYAGGQVGSQQSSRVRHGANTANVKRYIDFAARHGIDGVLVEGWNTGWEDWFGKWKEDVFDFVTPYPDYDINELSRYAKSKGVRIIMHHETSASVTNYERWMDTAYRLMKKHGMHTVKTGYVGRIIPRGEHHDGQWMIRHYERVLAKTAGYGIMVDAHEPVRPTGLHRTFPNYLAAEAARGNEFNAWSSGNPPEHETILPFTRLMGGPMDYTPGIFQIKMNVYDSSKKEQVHTTLAKQLALYVTLYSPLQMAADLPEHYEKHLDAFQFIKDVAVDWDDTRILAAEPGDYIVTARKAKGAPNWFLGAITDEGGRTITRGLDFLDAGKKYLATIYRDADGAHWEQNPQAYTIERFIVDRSMAFIMKMAPGGGMAVSFVPASAEDEKKYRKYARKR